ncbi:hypothetical protein [Rhizobium johnstonii]|uniref:hypothetical protein n=1 Tax=Rhizobium johnstonii TaxID=3019933 RepID=UPI003F97C399
MNSFPKTEADLQLFIRRLALRGQVLPIAAGFSVDESVREVTFRATAENGFRTTREVLDIAGLKRGRRLSSLLSFDDVEDLAKFQHVIGTAVEREPLDLQCGVVGSSRDWMNFFGIPIRRSYVSAYRRISPRALREQLMLRARWALLPFTFDFANQERLLTKCPRCNYLLGWSRAAAIQVCDRCASKGDHCDLREFDQETLDFPDHEAMRCVFSVIDPSPEAFSTYQIHRDFRGLSRGHLFQFCVRLAGAVSGKNPIRGLDPNEVGVAGRSILDWPEGFERLLTGDRCSKQHTSLSRLRCDPSLDPKLRMRIGQIFDQARRKEIFSRRHEIGSNRVHSPVRHSRVELKKLEASLKDAADKAISAAKTSGGEEALVKIVRDIRRCRELATVLGLPVFDLIPLYENGELPELDGELGDFFQRPKNSRSKSQLQLNSLGPSRQRPMPLIRALSLMRARCDHPWPEIFSAIRSGTLIVSRKSNDKTGVLAGIYTDDLDWVRNIPSTTSRFTKIAITQEEAARTLGISPNTFGYAVKYSFLSPGQTIADLNNFRQTWMFSFEVKDLFAANHLVPHIAFRKLVKSKVPRKAGHALSFWLRSDVYNFTGDMAATPLLPLSTWKLDGKHLASNR